MAIEIYSYGTGIDFKSRILEIRDVWALLAEQSTSITKY